MSWQKLLIFCKTVVILLAFAIFAYIGNQIFMPFGGELEAVYDFSEDSEYFSHLTPWQRLHPPAEDENGHFQQLKDDLVYFNFHMPQFFRDLQVELIYQSDGQEEVYFGPQVSEDNYKRELIVNEPAEKDNLYIANMYFDLRGVYTVGDDLRFVIAADGLNANESVLKIYQIKFILSRPTIDQSQVSPWAKNFIKRIYNSFNGDE